MIELIVVITIIMVITAIGTVSFSGANKKARDGKRLADLERIRMALEVARQVGTSYPVDASTVLVSSGYLTQWPVGPSLDTYLYERSTNYTYDLYARLEVEPTNVPDYSSCGTGACNYKVTQP